MYNVPPPPPAAGVILLTDMFFSNIVGMRLSSTTSPLHRPRLHAATPPPLGFPEGGVLWGWLIGCGEVYCVHGEQVRGELGSDDFLDRWTIQDVGLIIVFVWGMSCPRRV